MRRPPASHDSKTWAHRDLEENAGIAGKTGNFFNACSLPTRPYLPARDPDLKSYCSPTSSSPTSSSPTSSSQTVVRLHQVRLSYDSLQLGMVYIFGKDT